MWFDRVQIVSVVYVDVMYCVMFVEFEECLWLMFLVMKVFIGMIEGLIGICVCCWWDEGFQLSDVVMFVVEKVFEVVGIDCQCIGVLINILVCCDFIEFLVVCLVYGNFGFSFDCMNFDFGNVCLGFFNGMEIVGNMIECGQIDYGFVVDGESSWFVVEKMIEKFNVIVQSNGMFCDNFVIFMFGFGGVVMVFGCDDFVQIGYLFWGGVMFVVMEYNYFCCG